MTSIQDVADMLSPGLGKQVPAILAEVRANHARLESCAKHEFFPEGPGLPRYYVCRKCQGRVGFTDYLWYMRGLEHGRTDSA